MNEINSTEIQNQDNAELKFIQPVWCYGIGIIFDCKENDSSKILFCEIKKFSVQNYFMF